MSHDRLEYKIRGASRVPMFIFFTVIGFLVVIMVIQPMGPILGISTISIFLVLWAWFLISLIRESLNKPMSIGFGDDGIVYTTRRNTFLIAWGDIVNVLEMHAPPAPRGAPIYRITIFAENAPEFWFSEYMLHTRGVNTPQENYSDAKDFITRHVPGEKIRGMI